MNSKSTIKTCQILSTNEVTINNAKLYKIGYLKFKHTEEIIISDHGNLSLQRCNSSGENSTSIKINQHMTLPYALHCYEEKVYVTEFNGEKLCVFDSNYKFLRQCKLINKNLAAIEYIQIDGNLLYGSQPLTKSVKIWNIEKEQGGLVKSIENIECPSFIRIHKNKIYVCTNTKFEETTNKVISGSNCIYVYQKDNLECLKTIQFINMLAPAGIFIDKDSNIFTTAYSLATNNLRSQSRYLFIIDNTGNQIKEKIEIKNFTSCNCCEIFDKNLYISYNDKIKIIKFE